MRRLCVAVLSTGLATAPAVAAFLSGVVTDARGNAVAGVNLDFEVSATGATEKPANDGTSLAGTYLTELPPAVYDVYYIPPGGSRLAVHVERNVDLTVDRVVDVVLADAWSISGTVLRQADGLPVQGIDLDASDLVSGAQRFTPADNTDPEGRYRLWLPIGIYDISFDDPRELPEFAPFRITEVSVDGTRDIELPVIALGAGVRVDGEVLDDKGDGVVGADLDFIPAGTRDRIYTKRDNTDAHGAFATIVPPGTYDVLFNPPAGSELRPALRLGVVVPGAPLGQEVLEVGLAVSGAVQDSAGRPAPRVDLDVRRSAGQVPVPTVFDESDAAGNYLVRLPAGVFDIEFRSLRNTLLDPLSQLGVPIATDTVLAVSTLPDHDDDGDGVADVSDVCPFRHDPDQADADADGCGDACDDCPGAPDPRQEDNDRDGLGDSCDADDDGDGTSDDVDPDRDGDLVADVDDNCPQARNATQLDGDGNGAGDACDPGDGEVERVIAGTRTGFGFRAESGAIAYRVYRQRLSNLSRINYGVCHHDAAANVFHDTTVPDRGEAFVYLVTAVTGSGEGSLGRRSDGEPRPNLRGCE